jgi:hypothetical protein
MTRGDRYLVGAAFFVLLLIVVVFHYTDSGPTPPACVAGDNEICPPKSWVKMYDQQNQMGKALRSALPAGYFYNEQTGKFYKPAPAPAPVPPGTPAQAPAAQVPPKK